MVGHVVSLGAKTTTNKERHGYYGREQTMPAFLISYPCTRVVNSKEYMALVVYGIGSTHKYEFLKALFMHYAYTCGEPDSIHGANPYPAHDVPKYASPKFEKREKCRDLRLHTAA